MIDLNGKYLERVMRTMGFSKKWISLMMRCAGSVTYSIMINGQQCENILPTKGLRQGDPLLPYLFLLCLKGFSGILNRAMYEKKFQGVATSCHGKKVTHLFLLTIISYFVGLKGMNARKS